MFLADFSHPTTIAVLAVEAALLGLAFGAAFMGVLARPVRWLARGLAAVTLVLGVAGAVGMLLEMWTSPLPFVLPDAPLGTYAQMTQLGLLVGSVQFALVGVGAGLAFRRPGLGGLVLVLAGGFSLLDETRRRVQDPTLPVASSTFGIVAVSMVVLVAGALVLAAWRAEHRSPSAARARPSGRALAHRQP